MSTKFAFDIKEKQPKPQIEATPLVHDEEDERELREMAALVKVRKALSKKKKSRKDKQFFQDNPGLEQMILAHRASKLEVVEGEGDKKVIKLKKEKLSADLQEMVDKAPTLHSPAKQPESPALEMAPVPKKKAPEPASEPEVPKTPATPQTATMSFGKFF